MSGWTRTGDEYPPGDLLVLGWVVQEDGIGHIEMVCRPHMQEIWTDAEENPEKPLMVSHWTLLPDGPQ